MNTTLQNRPGHAHPVSMSTPSDTRFLSAEAVASLIRKNGLVASLRTLAAGIESDFLRWNSFEKCARIASHSAHGAIELMPIADAQHYTFKYVNGHPHNNAHGLPTVMAFGVLADVATGTPLLISELTLTTALRTAATSLVAARALVRPGSRVMALIGNGAQSEFQALAFHALLGIDEIRLFDTDPSATAKLLRNLQGNPDTAGLKLITCSSVAQAVRGADIVTTLTADKTRATIVTPDMLEPGMHINAVGGDCPGKTEVHADVLRAARVFVEYEPQTRIEGELQQMPADFAVTELWQVLAGHQTGRRSAADITLFDSVGFAIEDFSALRFLRALADQHAPGSRIDLIPTLIDPKDLYSLIKPGMPPAGAVPAPSPKRCLDIVGA